MSQSFSTRHLAQLPQSALALRAGQSPNQHSVLYNRQFLLHLLELFSSYRSSKIICDEKSRSLCMAALRRIGTKNPKIPGQECGISLCLSQRPVLESIAPHPLAPYSFQPELCETTGQVSRCTWEMLTVVSSSRYYLARNIRNKWWRSSGLGGALHGNSSRAPLPNTKSHEA